MTDVSRPLQAGSGSAASSRIAAMLTLGFSSQTSSQTSLQHSEMLVCRSNTSLERSKLNFILSTCCETEFYFQNIFYFLFCVLFWRFFLFILKCRWRTVWSCRFWVTTSNWTFSFSTKMEILSGTEGRRQRVAENLSTISLISYIKICVFMISFVCFYSCQLCEMRSK